jgi:hypothetical protein
VDLLGAMTSHLMANTVGLPNHAGVMAPSVPQERLALGVAMEMPGVLTRHLLANTVGLPNRAGEATYVVSQERLALSVAVDIDGYGNGLVTTATKNSGILK